MTMEMEGGSCVRRLPIMVWRFGNCLIGLGRADFRVTLLSCLVEQSKLIRRMTNVIHFLGGEVQAAAHRRIDRGTLTRCVALQDEC